MTEKLVFNRFLYMKLSYMSDGDILHDPSVREVEIFNDGMVLIRELQKGFDDWELKESLQADPYEIGLLYGNILKILECDRYDKETIETPNIQFSIKYSPNHEETCPPLLSDSNGISILSVIEGFISFSREDHSYYNWYSVAFNDFDDHGYSYFYDDDSIEIGDRVLVPVGKDNRECVGTVINFWRLPEERLPYPPEKTKKIIKKVDPPKQTDCSHCTDNADNTD